MRNFWLLLFPLGVVPVLYFRGGAKPQKRERQRPQHIQAPKAPKEEPPPPPAAATAAETPALVGQAKDDDLVDDQRRRKRNKTTHAAQGDETWGSRLKLSV